ncbi:MAG: alpha/beta hydrolase [Verrucomicrobiota bacterium]|nr:alpha/beta hydrolase [Verrucomicrobiota bacterium]
MRRITLGCAGLLAFLPFAPEADTKDRSPIPAQDHALTWQELTKLPLPARGVRISYGNAAQQFGELRVPSGNGPFPMFILIHGGCWLSDFDYAYCTRLAAWLTAHGFATWTIEFRRIGDEGGGWPGTFLDVAHAADALREIGKTKPIDTQRIYAAGHSAGGQLALWLASRGKLAKESELFIEGPIKIRGVLGLSAITDLYEYRQGPANSCHAAVERLLGGGPEVVERRYSETSPMQRLPLGVPQVFIQGENDPIVSPDSVRTYVAASSKAGDEAKLLVLPNGGHFEPTVPTAASEPALLEALARLTK